MLLLKYFRHWGVVTRIAALATGACINTIGQSIRPWCRQHGVGLVPDKTFDHPISGLAGEIAWSSVNARPGDNHGILSSIYRYRCPR